MSNPDDGGPAFPCTVGSSQELGRDYFGLTLRDWFAGQALPAMMGNELFVRQLAEAIGGDPNGGAQRDVMHQILARRSYMLADAMLAARKAVKS